MRNIFSHAALVLALSWLALSPARAEQFSGLSRTIDSVLSAHPELRLQRQQQSDRLVFLYFQQKMDGLAIYQSRLVLVWDVSKQDVVQKYDSRQHISGTRKATSVDWKIEDPHLDSLREEGYRLITERLWLASDESLQPALLIHFSQAHSSISGLYHIDTKKWISLGPNDLYLNHTDSSMHTKLFRLDPLSSSQTYYGSPIVDNGDMSSPDLEAEQEWVELPCYYDFDSMAFIAENDHAIIEEFSYPQFSMPAFADSTVYTRDQSEFEALMAMYHISAWQKTLLHLGIHLHTGLKLRVDTRALGGQDNSRFTAYYNGNMNELRFGIGGVDDAEDGDVIVHEYNHAIDINSNNNNIANFSAARLSLAEGFSDYFTAYNSLNFSTFMWDSIYTWDGHNSFWDGRYCGIENTDTFVLGGANKYQQGDVFASALLATALGTDLDSITTLVLKSALLYTENTSIPEAADIILDLDRIVFGGKYKDSLCKNFKHWRIPTVCDSNISVQGTEMENLKWQHTQSFSQRIRPMRIHSPVALEEIRLLVYNALGQLLYSQEFHQTQTIELYPEGLPSGLLFVTLRVENQIQTTPIFLN